VGVNFRLLDIDDFDALMNDLAIELASEDAYATARGGAPNVQSPTYDDTALEDASVDDLDHDLMLAVMREYCANLGRAPVTHDTLPALLREQGLLVHRSDSDFPTIGCLLLFGKEPQSRFPHAVVSGTLAGKKRVVFSGNLVRQRQALLEWLEAPEVNPQLHVKRRRTHEDRPAYPQRALVELMMNMLVHRDYQRAEPASVDVVPGEAVTFANPGGLMEAVVRQVKPGPDGAFRPVPRLSELRNPALCDVFFGFRAMERAGTGLADVEQMVRDHGGDSVFRHDSATNGLIARVSQPTASAGSHSVARESRPVGIYVVNILPFGSLPRQISMVRLKTSLRERPQGMCLREAGTFIERDGELWSFVPAPILLERLRPIACDDQPAPMLREGVEKDPESRKVLSWLLRKHFERQLALMRDRGLTLDEDRRRGRRRAYFEGLDGAPRTVVYDTPHRKGVQRQVVKQRADGGKAWFENEGFGYEVTWIDEEWGVRIKPFYMFTKRDARTPLPAFARAGRSTRRMKLDRNKNVEDDLTFWARFLGSGEATLNIGQEHVEDLILEASFLTIEVPSEGEDPVSTRA
jgi:hypothetical protein